MRLAYTDLRNVIVKTVDHALNHYANQPEPECYLNDQGKFQAFVEKHPKKWWIDGGDKCSIDL